MPGYVYRGTEFDATPKRGPNATRVQFDPALCGTTRGVSQHKHLKIKSCTKCSDYRNAQRRVAKKAEK
jgi:hypothetical protein